MERIVRYAKQEIRYTLIQTSRKSGLTAKIFPEGEIRVYAPKNVSLRFADQFVLQNAERILEAREKLKRASAQKVPQALSAGASIPVEGRMLTIEVHEGSVHADILEDRIVLFLPRPNDSAELQNALRQTLVRLALERFQEKLTLYGPRVGKEYGRVTIRDQKTRWGSCSSQHNLNFNWRLILAPPEVLEYVVVHELCHLWEFNHSKRFWELVGQQMPEYEIWKKWLKQHGPELLSLPV